ncbi:MAG: 5-formyltetrahydrofolate cyclo-ligase [Planctomycetales bacterium]|nr:5-formyltetrahydrofolate cyclo-ligase [Planctomycetales bacterium]
MRRDVDRHAERSEQIVQRVLTSTEYQSAHCLLCYVNVRSEVATESLIRAALQTDKQLVVPYCMDDQLRLFHLQARDELAPGAFGIDEPRSTLRDDPTRLVDPAMLELLILPGVAFDANGNRLGNGRGHFDRLLAGTSCHAVKMAICFTCQLFPQIPCEPHDIAMDCVLTESARFDRRK